MSREGGNRFCEKDLFEQNDRPRRGFKGDRVMVSKHDGFKNPLHRSNAEGMVRPQDAPPALRAKI
jgi:hypothetical protein